MFKEKGSKILLLLINLFFLEYALIFWEVNKLALVLEIFLLLSVPLSAFILREAELKLKGQMLFINLLFLILWLEGIISYYTSKQRIFLIITGLICLLGGLIIQLQYSNKFFFAYLKINNYIGLIIICCLFVLLSLETITEVPILDSGAYYAWSINKQAANFRFSFSSIAWGSRLAGHMAVGYGLFTLIGELLAPFNAMGVHLLNIALAVLSIIVFYNLLRDMFPQKNKNIILLTTAIYAFSPNLLGLVGTINVDVPGIYFLVIVLYCFKKGYWLLELFFSWAFICTKEPNAIYYAFFLMGILLYELNLLKTNRRKLIGIFMNLLSRATLLIWWVSYFLKSALMNWVTFDQESSVHRIGFSIQNLAVKLQQIFLMNFNWVFTISLVGMLLLCVITKRHLSSGKILIPLCMMVIGILLFNILYIDYSHPRYISIGAEIVLLVASIIMVELLNGKLQYVCISILVILLIAQSYASVDPLTTKIFIKISKSDSISSNLVNSTSAKFDDSSIYNREYSYYYKAVSKVLKKAGYDQNSVVVFSDFENIPKGYGYTELMYWNIKKNRIQTGEGENSIPLVIANDLEEMSNYEKILYIVPFFSLEDSNIKKNIEVEGIYEERYRTMSVKCYVGHPPN